MTGATFPSEHGNRCSCHRIWHAVARSCEAAQGEAPSLFTRTLRPRFTPTQNRHGPLHAGHPHLLYQTRRHCERSEAIQKPLCLHSPMRAVARDACSTTGVIAGFIPATQSTPPQTHASSKFACDLKRILASMRNQSEADTLAHLSRPDGMPFPAWSLQPTRASFRRSECSTF